MTNENVLDQTIRNLPFEVVAIYDNGSQILQQNTNSSLPPSVNVKIRIRNKEDTGTGRRGIISVPKLTAKNFPKKVRLVNSAQTIMSFNLALEPNSDEAHKKSNRRLFQMFKPGGCLSIHRDEDGYSYMPSTSNELKTKSTSGIEDYESSNNTGTFALKKNVFSTSYTDTLKTPKTFLGKCKPGGCLDPPFSEERYTYKPTVQDTEQLQEPAINTNSLHPDINIMDIKPMGTTHDQQINTLNHSYPETAMLGKTATLITYPSHLSSSKLETKDSQNRKPNLRMQSEQVELSRKLTNEFPEAFFIPPKKEKPKYGKSYDKYNYDEREPKVKESYVNKAYILQSQTPSELLSDALTITSQSLVEPLRGVIKDKQIIRELNTVTPLVFKSEELLNNKTSEGNIKTNSTLDSAEGIQPHVYTLLKEQNLSNHNNIPIIQNIFSNISESKNALDKDISGLNSSIKVNAKIQDTIEDINCKKNEDPNNNSDFEDKHQSMLYGINLSNEISTKSSKSYIEQESRIPLDNFEIREENNFLRQHPNVFNNEINKVELTDIKKPIVVQSEQNNVINPVKDKKSGTLEYEYVKNISGQVISNIIIKDDVNSETNNPKALNTVQRQSDDKSDNFDKIVSEEFENISESTESLAQDLRFIHNDNTEELIHDKTERTTEQIIDSIPFVVPDLIPKITSFHSLDKQLSLTKSNNSLISPKNNYVNPKHGLLIIDSSKSIRITNENNYADKHNEKQNKSFDTLENMLSPSLITGYTSAHKSLSMALESQDKTNEIQLKDNKLSNTDNLLIPQMLHLNSVSGNKIELDNHNRSTSPKAISIASKIKISKDTIESIDTGPRSRQELADFNSFEYRNSLNLSRSTSKKESTNLYPIINDSKIIGNQKTDINMIKKDFSSDDNLLKPANELTENNIKSLQTLNSPVQSSKKGIDKFESKESTFLSQNVDISHFPEFKLNKDILSITESSNFLKVLDKSELDTESSEKKSSRNFDNVQELKIIELTPELKESFTASKKNVNSSIEINFGFHTITNEKTGPTIRSFDPSINLENYPQDKIVTIKTILRKNDGQVKIQIDSETDLTMQLKPTGQMDGSRKLSSNILNSCTSDNRKHNIRVYSSEILINKDKLLQKTLNAMYETLTPIEQIIIKLKEEADLLHREQLLLKEVFISKKIKPKRLIPNVRTCSCLQREIGLE